MDPKAVLALTWIIAGLVVAAYIWFVVWRFRVERRKKEATAQSDSAMSDAITRTAQHLSAAVVESPPATASASSVAASASRRPDTPAPLMPTSPVSASASAPADGATAATVASMLSGISLPNDLVPLTTLSPRPGVGDRVAFWTDRAPAEIVGPAFASELERLGYATVPLDERSLSAQRDNERLLVVIHPDGATAVIGGQLAFASVPEMSVVIEVWVPA